MTALCAKTPEVFKNETSNHIKTHAPRLVVVHVISIYSIVSFPFGINLFITVTV